MDHEPLIPDDSPSSRPLNLEVPEPPTTDAERAETRASIERVLGAATLRYYVQTGFTGEKGLQLDYKTGF